MNIFPSERKRHELMDHLKTSWAESVIFIVFAIALLLLLISNSVSYG